jgi:hypothetical protein
VVGKYRTGKSYLINKIILNNSSAKGFNVGSTVNACTKGIWLWTEKLKSQNKDHEDSVVIVMDTEGFGAVTEGQNHDSRVVLFSMLLSSMFIYNSVGSIDENALQSLGLIVNMAKNIQKEGTGSQELDDETIIETFPNFVWVVRDFTLQLVDEQNFKISSNTYFERALNPVKGCSIKAEGKNKVRRLIKHFFRTRDCITMVRPVQNESDLQKLQELPDYRLRTEFLKQIDLVRNTVFQNVEPKKVNGRFVDGPQFIALAEAYTESVNSGKTPCIDNAWEFVRKFENKKRMSAMIQFFDSFLKVESKEGQVFLQIEFDQDNDLVAFANLSKLKLFQIQNQRDYTDMESKLVDVFEKNIIGELNDNKDLVDELKYELNKKVTKKFVQMENEIKQLLEKDLQNCIEKETEILLNKSSLNLKSCEEKYKQIWKNKVNKYSVYFENEEKLQQKFFGIFEKQKAEMLKKILQEVQMRQEISSQKMKEEEKLRKFRVLEKEKQLEQDKLTIENDLNEAKKTNTKRLMMLKQKEEDLQLTTTKLKQLEIDQQTHLNQIEDLNKKVVKVSEENATLQKRVIELQMELTKEKEIREKLVLQEKKFSQEKEISLKEEINRLESELKTVKQEQTDQNKLIEEMQKERERTDRVILDTEQLTLLQQKLEEAVERASNEKQIKEQLQEELKEKQMTYQLDKERLKLMEDNFTQIKANNNQFIQEVTTRIDHLQQKESSTITETLSENLQVFLLWKKVLQVCNLLQCGKCGKFSLKTHFLNHMKQCLSLEEKQSLQLKEIDWESVKDLDFESQSLLSPTNLNCPDFQHLNIQIIQTLVKQEMVQGELKPFTEYIFRVRREDSSQEWHVSRKFKDFCQLLVDLQEECPDGELPESCFEFWSYINDIWGLVGDSCSTDKREELLQNMVQDLGHYERLADSSVFKNFVCLPTTD